MRVLVIHGPNLNLLGERQPEIYGRMTLPELNDFIAAAARELGVNVDCVQHNGEGEIISAIHDARTRYDGIVIAAINIGAHVDRIPTGEMIDRFLPLLQATAASVQPMLM